MCEVFAGTLRRYGIPDEILTDNAKVFTGRFGPHPVGSCSTGSAGRTASPTATPAFALPPHRQDRAFPSEPVKEFLADRTFDSVHSAQSALDAWVEEYNTRRSHQALEMATPAERFRLTPLATDAASVPVDDRGDQPGQWVLRRVASNGLVSVDNQMFSVGNAYKAQLVDVFVDDTVIQVWHQNHLIRTIARTRAGRVGKVRADALRVKHQPTTQRQASTGT